ncbi:hypothetical protein ACFLU5_12825 [Bacteroidota bacterium]
MSPYYDDDGTEINPDLIPQPDLCLICKKLDDPNEEIPCTLNRVGQKDDIEFECGAFEDLDN